jgi:cephalosporin-C deacetylase-like acetyl esterase
MVEKRTYEIGHLLNQITDKNFSKDVLKVPGLEIDIDKLAIVGHSIGSSTALMAGSFDDRIKAILMMDC